MCLADEDIVALIYNPMGASKQITIIEILIRTFNLLIWTYHQTEKYFNKYWQETVSWLSITVTISLFTLREKSLSSNYNQQTNCQSSTK